MVNANIRVITLFVLAVTDCHTSLAQTRTKDEKRLLEP
jgi:hypothetical protein